MQPKQSATASPNRRPSSEHPFGLNDSYLRSSTSVSVKMEPQDYSPPTTIGLGIVPDVACLPVTQSLPMHDWAAQPIIGTSACFNPTIGAPDYGPHPYFRQQYPGDPVVSQSMMRYSELPRDHTAPVYYNANMNTRNSQSPVYHEATVWPITPQSQISTPVRYPKQEPHTHSPTWEQSLSPSGTTLSHRSLAVDQRLGDLGIGGESHEQDGRSPSADVSEPETCHRGSVERSPSLDSLSLELGLLCEICGRKFTRRANCREHTRRHDPKQRTIVSCKDCGKTFGRKTDLKRHYSTVHDGEKRFSCERCGRAYSRMDTLHRHNKTGCSRRKRRSPSAENSDKFKQVQRRT
ncbi:hypothetical protein BGW36DRAFT_425620 [Talaromyces proteolyticus]|uniref:C2H2-type domain-containing protein n=1 Tax=Talaromyces proteolyticus TaxID=1131652 RepID=A0AAD4KZQ4_9EURO|nr:uncharacterized protein BGW36DRAFT_425620 [Talaromyces proteolyticus]KAH8700815.1 hypothetical protein BGW36DRAFT_425620 [Talaromyces proteolyticus]